MKPEQMKPGKKAKWEKPELQLIGKVQDFVRGGGKSGITIDNDPNSATKSNPG